MSKVKEHFVSKLRLNWKNPRCKINAEAEKKAVFLNIEDDPSGFKEMLDSVYQHGYAAEEGNLVVVKDDDTGNFVVYDGNSRLSALKLLLGQITLDKDIKKLLGKTHSSLISTVSQDKEWKKLHNKVPCVEVSLRRAYEVMEKVHTETGKARTRKWNTGQRYRFKSMSQGQTAAYINIFNRFITSNFLKVKESEHALRHVRRKNPDTLVIFERKFPVAVYKDAAMPKYLEATGLSIEQLDRIYPDGMKNEEREAFENFMLKIGLGYITTVKARQLTNDSLRDKYGISTVVITSENEADPNDLNQPAPHGNGSQLDDDNFGEPEKDNDPIEIDGVGPEIFPGAATTSGDNTENGQNKSAYHVQINELKKLANAAGHYKMVQCLGELKSITGLKKNNFPIAAAILIRTCLEISARYFAEQNKINYKGKTLECILSNIHSSGCVNDPGVYTVLGDIKLKKDSQPLVKSLNVIVHHLSYTPTWDEIKIHFNNIHGLCVFFLKSDHK